MINSFDKLQIVQESHTLTLKIYRLVGAFPTSEKYHLSDQICRSISSVPANIVEGNSRNSRKEFAQFLYQARASLAETQYHLLLAKDLKYIQNETYNDLIVDSDILGKKITSLIKYLKNKP